MSHNAVTSDAEGFLNSISLSGRGAGPKRDTLESDSDVSGDGTVLTFVDGSGG